MGSWGDEFLLIWIPMASTSDMRRLCLAAPSHMAHSLIGVPFDPFWTIHHQFQKGPEEDRENYSELRKERKRRKLSEIELGTALNT